MGIGSSYYESYSISNSYKRQPGENILNETKNVFFSEIANVCADSHVQEERKSEERCQTVQTC